MLSFPGEECFNSFTEPIARIPTWLKQAPAELGLQTQGRVVAPKDDIAPAKSSTEQGMNPTKTQFAWGPVQGSMEKGGCAEIVGVDSREVPVSRTQPPWFFVRGVRLWL
jgi:hypothetical protein